MVYNNTGLAAKICMTHSFMVQNIKADVGEWDASDKDYEFMKQYIENVTYDDYDKLMQLCDSLAMATGFCLLEKRFVDVHRRYGVGQYTVARWNAVFEIKDYFEKWLGCSIYDVLPGVKETTFMNTPLWKPPVGAISKDGFFAIELLETGHCIGCINLKVYPEHEKAVFGYVLNRKYWNQGYMTETLTAILNFGFKELELNRIEATHYSGNPASGKVMEKCGMKKEGYALQEVKIKGVFQDVVHYAVLRTQWNDVQS